MFDSLDRCRSKNSSISSLEEEELLRARAIDPAGAKETEASPSRTRLTAAQAPRMTLLLLLLVVVCRRGLSMLAKEKLRIAGGIFKIATFASEAGFRAEGERSEALL